MHRARHVILYGPPGAGKLTVAKVLAARYGVALLDNHIAVDAALRLFEFGAPGFGELCEQIRVTMLRAAAEASRDVVSTFAYGFGADDEAMQTLIDASAPAGAGVTVVQLLPSDDELRRRVVSADRHASNKVSDLELLAAIQAQYDMRTPFPGTHLRIDNTDVPPADVAAQIARHVGLSETAAATSA